MQRPAGIKVTTALMCLAIVADLVVVFTLAPQVDLADSFLSSALRAAHVLTFVNSFIAAFVVVVYWNGQNWARWLVIIDSVLCLFWLLHVDSAWELSHPGAVLIVAKALLSIYLLFYLTTRGIRTWFSERTTRYHGLMDRLGRPKARRIL